MAESQSDHSPALEQSASGVSIQNLRDDALKRLQAFRGQLDQIVAQINKTSGEVEAYDKALKAGGP